MRLGTDLLERLEANGPDWQICAKDMLLRAVELCGRVVKTNVTLSPLLLSVILLNQIAGF